MSVWMALWIKRSSGYIYCGLSSGVGLNDAVIKAEKRIVEIPIEKPSVI